MTSAIVSDAPRIRIHIPYPVGMVRTLQEGSGHAHSKHWTPPSSSKQLPKRGRAGYWLGPHHPSTPVLKDDSKALGDVRGALAKGEPWEALETVMNMANPDLAFSALMMVEAHPGMAGVGMDLFETALALISTDSFGPVRAHRRTCQLMLTRQRRDHAEIWRRIDLALRDNPFGEVYLQGAGLTSRHEMGRITWFTESSVSTLGDRRAWWWHEIKLYSESEAVTQGSKAVVATSLALKGQHTYNLLPLLASAGLDFQKVRSNGLRLDLNLPPSQDGDQWLWQKTPIELREESGLQLRDFQEGGEKEVVYVAGAGGQDPKSWTAKVLSPNPKSPLDIRLMIAGDHVVHTTYHAGVVGPNPHVMRRPPYSSTPGCET